MWENAEREEMLMDDFKFYKYMVFVKKRVDRRTLIVIKTLFVTMIYVNTC